MFSQIKSHVIPRIYPIEKSNTNKVKNIRIDGINYLITTNANIQDKTTRRFIDSLVSSQALDDEESYEELYEEKESLERILFACTIINDEITKLTSSLKNRLNKL